MLDGGGKNFADVFEPGNRRIWVPLADVPDFVQKAFVAAEDRRFFQHHGVDERGIIRAFIGNLAEPGRPQGGSTITQQVVKNLLVGEDVTYERKIREMIVASRLESTLSKNEILELYLNSAYLGRGSWGVEMAARSYFGKSAKDLTPAEGAMLAGLLKGPNYLQSRPPSRSRQGTSRLCARPHAGGRRHHRGAKGRGARRAAEAHRLFTRPHRDSRLPFRRLSRPRGQGRRRRQPDRRFLHGALDHQRAIAARHRSGAAGRLGALRDVDRAALQFRGPEANIADAVQKLAVDNSRPATPAWQQALQAVRLPLYDVHWTPAVVVQKGDGKKGDDTIRVGLPDGRIMPLIGLERHDQARPQSLRRRLCQRRRAQNRSNRKSRRKPGRHQQSQQQEQNGAKISPSAAAPQAQLRVRPTVQGAALVLENKTGRILAMAGGFSYPLSQLNRAAQTQRQPGSAIKPLTYLTALQRGLQPNTLVLNEPITLPPIGSGVDGRDAISREYGGSLRPEDFWSPRNADYGEGGVFTMRRGLENSVNVVTAHLLDGGIDADPEKSLDAVCATAVAAKIYPHCVRYYPFVLGAQPVRMIDLAAFYAAVANEGALPQPHGIDSIEQNGKTIYQYPKTPLPRIGAADRTSFYQLKTMLQGVVARGTARGIGGLSPYVAGKTGTTEDAVDGWFIGFTNDVTVAVWVGYDNGDGKRRSLGSNETGARVALPIFQPIIEAIWAEHIAPKAPLNGPSPEASAQLADIPIDYMTGDRLGGGQRKTRSRALDSASHRARARHLSSISAAAPTAKSPTRNISWSRATTPMPIKAKAATRAASGTAAAERGAMASGSAGAITQIRAGAAPPATAVSAAYSAVPALELGPRELTEADNSRKYSNVDAARPCFSACWLGLLGFAAAAPDFIIDDVSSARKDRRDAAQIRHDRIQRSHQRRRHRQRDGADPLRRLGGQGSDREKISRSVSELYRADRRQDRERQRPRRSPRSFTCTWRKRAF